MTFHEFLAGSSRDHEKLTWYNAQAVFLGSWVVYLGGPCIDVVSGWYGVNMQWNIPTITEPRPLPPHRRTQCMEKADVFLEGFSIWISVYSCVSLLDDIPTCSGCIAKGAGNTPGMNWHDRWIQESGIAAGSFLANGHNIESRVKISLATGHYKFTRLQFCLNLQVCAGTCCSVEHLQIYSSEIFTKIFKFTSLCKKDPPHGLPNWSAEKSRRHQNCQRLCTPF